MVRKGFITLIAFICLVTSDLTTQCSYAQGTADWSTAHTDIIINYITWDGSSWTAKIQPDLTFLHAPKNNFSAPAAHSDVIINYKTWDGSNWTAKIQPDLTFVHAPNGDFTKSHTDSIINYLTWNTSLWTAQIQSDLSFLHAPVLDAAGKPIFHALGGTTALGGVGPGVVGATGASGAAIPADIVHIVAAQDCYFGGTEDSHQAASGAFGTVFIQKGHSYDWHVSASGKALYWAAIPATGGPMPAHMVQRGTVYGGHQQAVP